MQKRIFLNMLIVVAVTMYSCTVSAQGKNQLNRKQKDEIISSLLQNLNEIYIFPEVAKKSEKQFRQLQKDGAYSKVNDAFVLADTLTNQLRRILNDKHLKVWYDVPIIAGNTDTLDQYNKRIAKERLKVRRNWGFPKMDILEGNIGYLKITAFHPMDKAAKVAAAAMTYLENTDALILDLNLNHGGDPATVQFLASYFFDSTPVHLNDMYYREGNQTEEYWTLAEVPGKRYLNKPVYILASKGTFSAGEEFTYDMQSLKRATILGENTGGGANPGGTVELKQGFTVFIPNGRAVNPITKTNWEGTGVTPNIKINPEQSLKAAHILALKTLLQTASDEEIRNFYTESLKKIE